MTNLQQLREKLQQGFYVDNLYEIAGLCKSLALDTASPAPFFVMEHIFLDIARHWEDRPLPVEEAALVESKLMKPLEDLVLRMVIKLKISYLDIGHLLNYSWVWGMYVVAG